MLSQLVMLILRALFGVVVLNVLVLAASGSLGDGPAVDILIVAGGLFIGYVIALWAFKDLRS